MIALLLEDFRLNGHNSWMQGVYHALKWLREQVGEEAVPGELFQMDTQQAWKDFQPAAGDIKKLLKQAEQSHLCKVTSLCDLQSQGELQDQLLREIGWTQVAEQTEDGVPEMATCFPCDECE